MYIFIDTLEINIVNKVVNYVVFSNQNTLVTS